VEAGCFLEKVGRGSKIEKKSCSEQKKAWTRFAILCKLHEIRILRRIIKTVATRCPISKLKCTKFDSAPDPAWGAYSAPQLNLRRLYFEGKGGKTGRMGKGGGEESGWDLLQRRRGRGKVAS